MEEIKFIKLGPTSNDVHPLEIEGFTNLGRFTEVGAGNVPFDTNPGHYSICKIFLVIADEKFSLIVIKNPEDIFTFLQEKGWYTEKSTRLLFFKLYSNWMEIYRPEEERIEELGIHPLVHDKAVKEIFKSLNPLLNFN